MADYVTPVNQFLKSIDLQPYDRYLPNAFNDSLSLLEKVNKVIYHLNETNQLSNELVNKWNAFAESFNMDAIDQNIETKVSEFLKDDTLIQLIDVEIMSDFKNEITKSTNETVNTLSERFDEIPNQVSTLTVKSNKKRPIVTILDDDGRPEVYTRLLPISQSKNVPFCTAVISGRLNSPAVHMSPKQIKELQNNYGWEVLGHSFTHPTGNSGLMEYAGDYEKLEYEIGGGCKKVLTDLGFNVTGFVYPQSGNDFNIREITKNHYDYSFAQTGINDDKILDTMQINRISFGYSTELNPTINGNSEKNTLAYYKACVDYAVTNNAWLVFMLHVNATDPSQDQVLSDLIDYIKSVNVDIVTAKEGYKIHGNKYFAGDVPSKKYFVVDKNNQVRIGGGDLSLKTKIVDPPQKNANDLIETYDNECITYMRCTASYGTANGLPGAGYLITHKFISSPGYNRQEYWVYLSNDKYTRFVNADGSWSAWTQINKFKTTMLNVATETIIPPNSSVDIDIPFVGLQANVSHVSVSPAWGLIKDVQYNSMVKAHGILTIRLFNGTGTPQTVTPRNWLVSYVLDAR